MTTDRERSTTVALSRARALAVIVAAGLTLCGCGANTTRVSAEEFAAVDTMPVHMAGSAAGQQTEAIGEIEGVSCNDTGYPANHPRARPVTRYEALYRLRLAAAGQNADRVIEVECEARVGGFADACDTSIVCAGIAATDVDTTMASDTAKAEVAAAAAEAEEQEFVVPAGFRPDYLTERQREALGTLSMTVPRGQPGSTVVAPASPEQAAAMGAGQWALRCIGQGGYFGLILSPACALLGATVGATSAEDPEVVAGLGEAISGALDGFYRHEALRDEVARVALAGTSQPFEVRDRARRHDAGIDTVLEVGVEELLLPAASDGAVSNLPSSITVRARARVIRVSDRAVLYDRAYRFTSEARRFSEWGMEGGAPVSHALTLGYRDLAERIVDDVLLVYPLMPVFGAASLDQADHRRRYLVEPIFPVRHGYDFEGRVWPSAADSLEPTLRWAPFPDATVTTADFQGLLASATALRYDLRVYRVDPVRREVRLVREHVGVEGTQLRLEQPLAPDSDYVWTLRARFLLDGAQRTTRWSGDWLGRNVKGFAFYTPR